MAKRLEYIDLDGLKNPSFFSEYYVHKIWIGKGGTHDGPGPAAFSLSGDLSASLGLLLPRLPILTTIVALFFLDNPGGRPRLPGDLLSGLELAGFEGSGTFRITLLSALNRWPHGTQRPN